MIRDLRFEIYDIWSSQSQTVKHLLSSPILFHFSDLLRGNGTQLCVRPAAGDTARSAMTGRSTVLSPSITHASRATCPKYPKSVTVPVCRVQITIFILYIHPTSGTVQRIIFIWPFHLMLSDCLPPSYCIVGSSSLVKRLKHLTSQPTQPTTLDEPPAVQTGGVLSMSFGLL